MKNKIYKLAALLLGIAVMTAMLCLSADAASASLWFTDPTVTVGTNVTVVVDVKGEDIGGYQMRISYDKNYLDFLSCTGGSGNLACNSSQSGVLVVTDYMGSGSAAKMSFNLTFRTKKTGTTKLTPSGFLPTSGGGDDITPYAVGDSTINIIPVPQASSDATLKSLAIGSGALSPAFSPSVTSYTANVDFSVTSLAVTALKNHSGASVYISGNDNLAVGENTVNITVTAENGAKMYYSIKVIRGKNPLSTDVFLNVSTGGKAEVAATFKDSVLPKGFEKTSVALGGQMVDAAKYDDRANFAVYLLGNESVKEGLYFVDVDNMAATPFEYAGQVDSSILLLDVDLCEIPEDYEKGLFFLDGKDIEALVPQRVEAPNHCLVYGVGDYGTPLLYIYDPVEKTFQRYGFAEMGPPETTIPETEPETTSPETVPDTTVPAATDGQDATDNEKTSPLGGNVFMWIIMGIAVFVFGLTVVSIILSKRQY